MSTETTTTTTAAAPGANGSAPTAPVTTTTPPASSPQATEWTAGLNDELKGYVQNKGFKAPADVLESYRNYEKLQGVPQDRLLKLPESLDSEEGKAIWQRLGAPKDAKDYSIAIPKENGDEKLAGAIRDIAHKNNFTQKQVGALVEWWNGYMDGARNEQKLAGDAKRVDADNTLKKEWGNAYDQNKEIAERGAVAMGINDQQLAALGSALGHDGALKLLHKLGASTGEANFISGGPGGGSTSTAEQAKAKILQLQVDQGFIARIRNKDSDALREWDGLHKTAYPGTQGL